MSPLHVGRLDHVPGRSVGLRVVDEEQADTLVDPQPAAAPERGVERYLPGPHPALVSQFILECEALSGDLGPIRQQASRSRLWRAGVPDQLAFPMVLAAGPALLECQHLQGT